MIMFGAAAFTRPPEQEVVQVPEEKEVSYKNMNSNNCYETAPTRISCVIIPRIVLRCVCVCVCIYMYVIVVYLCITFSFLLRACQQGKYRD